MVLQECGHVHGQERVNDIVISCGKAPADTKLYYLRYTRHGDVEGVVNDGIGACGEGQSMTIGYKQGGDYVQRNGGKIGLRVLVGEKAYFFGILTKQPDDIRIAWRDNAPAITADGARLTRYETAKATTEALRP